jgi:hypothetical protein
MTAAGCQGPFQHESAKSQGLHSRACSAYVQVFNAFRRCPED